MIQSINCLDLPLYNDPKTYSCKHPVLATPQYIMAPVAATLKAALLAITLIALFLALPFQACCGNSSKNWKQIKKLSLNLMMSALIIIPIIGLFLASCAQKKSNLNPTPTLEVKAVVAAPNEPIPLGPQRMDANPIPPPTTQAPRTPRQQADPIPHIALSDNNESTAHSPPPTPKIQIPPANPYPTARHDAHSQRATESIDSDDDDENWEVTPLDQETPRHPPHLQATDFHADPDHAILQTPTPKSSPTIAIDPVTGAPIFFGNNSSPNHGSDVSFSNLWSSFTSWLGGGGHQPTAHHPNNGHLKTE